MTRRLRCLVALAAVGLAAACGGPRPTPAHPAASQGGTMPDTALQARIARFAPVDIGADLAALPPAERQALARLVEAARVTDALFLRQVWAGNEPLLHDLLGDESPLGRARLRYFLMNKGPWSRLDHNEAFIPGVPRKPDGANYYPAGASKGDVEAWLRGLSEAERHAATGFFTTIRRAPDGTFIIAPYSIEYQGELGRMAELLRDAAAHTTQPTLKRFLAARAAAFLTNDYYASDVAWMELDSSLEPTIGPYEVYEDEWFNYKAAFEAFITVRDDAETTRLARLSGALQDVEDHLPIDPAYRNPKLGGLAPIRVVNEIFAAGEANRGVQTAAFNLPNDERVIREKGSKRVMLKNVQQAKFSMVLVPISRVVLAPGDQGAVAFDAFFTHILMHELMHGLGPHNVTAGGRRSTVRQELKDTYSAIEEAKADVSGLFAMQYLIDQGVLDRQLEATMYTTFLASAFRSIRFGVNEAHGRGIAIQLNTLLDRGAVVAREGGTFAVDAPKFKAAVRDLTREIMTLEARGDYDQAKDLIARLAVLRPEVKQALDRLANVPVDIAPRFVTAEQLAPSR
ncbi:MAG TPA: hypothetical protein VGQ83_05750 [Polyangia bacterium]|jgi:hypothetical protein